MKRIWEWWKRVARKIGDYQARVILTLFYLIILGPFAIAVRLFSDPLGIAPRATKGWRPRNEATERHLDRALRQF